MHRALVQVVLDGGEEDELAAELADVLSGPVLLTTPDGRVRAAGGRPDDLDRVRSAA